MGKDFWLASMKVLQTFWLLGKGKAGPGTTECSGDIVEEWREHFEEELNLTYMSLVKKAGSEDSSEEGTRSLALAAEVFKKLFCGKVLGEDEICL